MENESPKARLPRWFAIYMMIVGVGGNLFFYIQAGEIFVSRQAKDVSFAAFAVALFAVSSWLVYGLLLRDKIIIIANIVAVIGASLVLTGKLLYG